MSPSEYQELVEFLADKFGWIEKKFDRIHARFDEQGGRLARLEVSHEEMRRDFNAFGEKLDGVDRKVDRLREDMDRRFDTMEGTMKVGFKHWGARVQALEEKIG